MDKVLEGALRRALCWPLGFEVFTHRVDTLFYILLKICKKKVNIAKSKKIVKMFIKCKKVHNIFMTGNKEEKKLFINWELTYVVM